jgi:hypothetical protein
MVSNPSWGMDVCVCLFCVCVVLCVRKGLAMAWPPFTGPYRLFLVLRDWKAANTNKMAAEPSIIIIKIYVLRYHLGFSQGSSDGDLLSGTKNDVTWIIASRVCMTSTPPLSYLLAVVMPTVWKTDINDRAESAALTTRHPSIRKSWH